MRSRTNDTVSVRAVHAHAATLIETHLEFRDHGHKCRATVLISILLFAAARMRSIFDACGRLRDSPSDQAVRDALVAMLPEMDTLERRINAGLSAELPRGLTKRPQRLAVDLTLIPYHGRPFHDANEIYRSQPKSGTTHFHAYASCYVVEHGQRFTLAMRWVAKDEPPNETLRQLLKQVRPHLRLLPQLCRSPKTSRPQTIGVCVLGISARSAGVGPRGIPQAVWHRDQLPANEPVPHPNVHAEPRAAAVVCGHRPAAAKRLGLVSLERPGRPPCQRPIAVTAGTAPPDDADPHAPTCRRTPSRMPGRPGSRNP